MTVEIIHGDCLAEIPRLVARGVIVDAIVCDPPYHLTSTVNRFGKVDIDADTSTSRRSRDRSDPAARLAKGFMGKVWDGGDVAFRPETWATVATILRPGGFLVAFGGTRTYHRLACAIEDGGFVIQDCLMWLYGCLDEQTEAVTIDGIKPYHKIMEGDLVLCYDPTIGGYSYQPVLEVVVYEYDDTAYRLIGDFGEQVVSRNHRCIVERGGRELFEYAEALEREAYIPILEGLPELQSALSDVHERAGHPKQNVLEDVRQRDSRNRETKQLSISGSSRRKERSDVCSLWNDVLAQYEASIQGKGPGLLVPMQRDSSRGGVETARPQGARPLEAGVGIGPRRTNDRIDEPGLEGWDDISQSQGEIYGISDQVCPLPNRIYRDGPQGRLHHGASANSGKDRGKGPHTIRNGPPPYSQAERERFHEPDVIRDECGSQVIRAWEGHRASLVRVVPFHLSGRVWCLRVPTGAFVAVRNGVAFPTGNSGFPKRRDMLKPSYEPIVLAYKPGGPRTMQVDECRVGITSTELTEKAEWHARYGERDYAHGAIYEINNGIAHRRISPPSSLGRWPANVLTDGSDEVRSLFPDSTGQQSDITGEEPSHKRPFARRHGGMGGFWSPSDGKPCGPTYGDEPDRSAARFFFSAGLSWTEKIKSHYGHASFAEGCSNLQSGIGAFALRNAVLRLLVGSKLVFLNYQGPSTSATASELRLICDLAIATIQNLERRYSHELQPLKLSLTLDHARCVAILKPTGTTTITISHWKLSGSADPVTFDFTWKNMEAGEQGSGGNKRFHYLSKADLDDRWHSRHPTVKPVDMISWLVRLVVPPGGTFLDPFAGSGTAGAAAIETGRSAILIEREAEYVADIRERLASLRGQASRPAPARRSRPEPGGLMDLVDEGE